VNELSQETSSTSKIAINPIIASESAHTKTSSTRNKLNKSALIDYPNDYTDYS